MASDEHAEKRKGGNTYQVQTVSLADLLREHKAPKAIDYVSIDVEGAEREVLNAFDFSFDISILTIEHNYRERDRAVIRTLLTARGYTPVFEALSMFEDWYVKSSLLTA